MCEKASRVATSYTDLFSMVSDCNALPGSTTVLSGAVKCAYQASMVVTKSNTECCLFGRISDCNALADQRVLSGNIPL